MVGDRALKPGNRQLQSRIRSDLTVPDVDVKSIQRDGLWKPPEKVTCKLRSQWLTDRGKQRRTGVFVNP